MEYNKEPDDSILKSVSDSDTVAGWFFRKFINEYKEYDAAQKKLIEQQQTRIDELEKELAWYTMEVPEDDTCLKIKLREKNMMIYQLNSKICKLKSLLSKAQHKLNKKHGKES